MEAKGHATKLPYELEKVEDGVSADMDSADGVAVHPASHTMDVHMVDVCILDTNQTCLTPTDSHTHTHTQLHIVTYRLEIYSYFYSFVRRKYPSGIT